MKLILKQARKKTLPPPHLNDVAEVRERGIKKTAGLSYLDRTSIMVEAMIGHTPLRQEIIIRPLEKKQSLAISG
jgi:hypothetical protein